MAGTTTTLKVKVSEEGAKEAAAQVRNLGDNAAGAARGFSQMQKGLGGFVGAYAGAAATFFALQQGFSALKEAAKLEQSIQGTRTLASAIGVSGDEVLGKIKLITRGQLSLRDAAESANLALSSGFDTSQIETLTTIASKASIALGRDLGDSFVRLVRGAAKLEPELLDELGLFTRIEPAVQAYAASLGKSEKYLTNFERRQAFVNAIMEEGNRKFAGISLSTDTPIASLERLATTVYDLGQKIGGVLATFLKPFADFMSGSFANSLSVVAGIGALAFSKAGSLLGGAISSRKDQWTKGITDWQQSLHEKNKKLAPDFFERLSESASNFNLNSAGKSKERNDLIKSLQAEKASYEDIVKAATMLKQVETERSQAIKDRIGKSGADAAKLDFGILSAMALNPNKLKPADLQAAILAELNKQTGVAASTVPHARKGSGALSPAGLKNTMADLAAMGQGASLLKMTEEFDKAQSKFSRGLSSVGNGLKSAIGFVGTFIEGLSALVGKFFLIITLVELFGSALLRIFGLEHEFDSLLKNFFDMGAALLGMTKNAEAFKNSIAAIADITTRDNFKKMGLKDTDSSIFSGWFGLESPNSTAELKKKVESAVTTAYNAMTYTSQQMATGPGVDYMGGVIAMSDKTEFDPTNFTRSLEGEIRAVEKLVPMNDAAVKSKQALLQTYKDLIAVGPGVIDVIRNVTLVSDISPGDLTNLTKKYKTTSVEGGAKLDVEGGSLFMENRDSVVARAEEYKKRWADPAAGQNSYDDAINVSSLAPKMGALASRRLTLEKYLSESKNLSAEGLSQQEAGLTNSLKEIEKSMEEIGQRSQYLFGIELERLNTAREILEVQRKLTKEALNQSQAAGAVLTRHDQMRKTFQAELNIASEISGYWNTKGELATRPQDVRANQLEVLSQTAEYTKKFGPNSTGIDLAKYQAGLDAVKIMSGMLVKNMEEVTKYGDEFSKQLIHIRSEYEIINLTIKKVISEGLVIWYDYNIKLATLNRDIANQEADIASKSRTLQLQAGAIGLQSQMNRLSAQKDLLDSIMKTRDAQVAYNQSLREANAIQRDSPLNMRSAIYDQFAGLASDRQKRELSITIDENKLKDFKDSVSDQIAAIDANTEAKNKQFELERSIAETQYKLVQNQAAQDNERINLEISKIDQQITLLEAEREWKTKLWTEQVHQAELDRDIAVKRIEAEKELKDAEFKVVQQRLDILNLEARILTKHVEELGKVFALGIASSVVGTENDPLAGKTAPDGLDYDTKSNADKLKALTDYFGKDTETRVKSMVSDFGTGFNAIQNQFNSIKDFTKKAFESNIELQDKQLQNKVDAINNEYNLYMKGSIAQTEYQKGLKANLEYEKKLAGARVEDAARTYQETLRKIAEEQKSTGIISETSKQKLLNEQQSLEKQLEIAKKLNELYNNSLFTAAVEVVNVIKNDLTQGLQALNQSMLDGTLTLQSFTDGLKDWARTLIGDIEKAIIQKVVIEPITNWVQETMGNAIMNLLGFDLSKPGSSPLNPMWVKSADLGVGGGSGGGMFGGLFGGISNLFGGYSWDGMASGSMLQGLTDQANIFASMGLALSSGGSVRRMANGGQFGRDTVPARLEPDEYVLRSSAARSIGMHNLNRMNNLGAAGVAPNVNVNVQNNGTPQEVQGKPNVRFDGSKMVVDIVLKDFANNGPIRQTLRGDKF